MFDLSIDESEELNKLQEEVIKIKDEYLIRSRRLYLYQLELEKKIHQLHEHKTLLSDHIEKLEYLNSQLPSQVFHQHHLQDFSFSNNGTEETTFSFIEVEENAEINKIPHLTPDYQSQKILEIPYFYSPGRTGYEITRDFPIIIGETISDKYRIDRTISNTQISCLLSCLDTHKKTKVCVKIILNDKQSFKRGLNELRILKNLQASCKDISQHNIIKLLDYFYFKEHLFIVQELLYEPVSNISEIFFENVDLLQRFATDVLKALDLLSVNNIIHCDLNTENILQAKKPVGNDFHYKIIDFNSSILNKDKELFSYPMLAYAAPEISEGKFTCAIDMWSFGCLLIELYKGKVLFTALSEQQLLYQIQETIGPLPGKHVENTKNWDSPQTLDDLLSNENHLFKDFIKKTLATDPRLRITPKKALSHPWLN